VTLATTIVLDSYSDSHHGPGILQ